MASGRSFLDHGNSVPDARVGGLSRARQQLSNSHCPSIFVHMIATHTAKYMYLYFNALGGSVPWKRTMILLAARIRSSLFLNLDKRSLCSRMCIGNF